MPNDPAVLLTIVAMALVTYLTRAGGFWLMRRTSPSPFLTACLNHLPGALLIAIIVPLLLKGGYAEWIAAGVTVLTMSSTGSLLLTLAAGVGAIWLIRMVW